MDDKTVEEVAAPAKKEKPVFLGFNTSFKGYSQMANEWLDEICSQIDSMAELKIVLYVYRHTWGFQKKSDSPDEPAEHDKMKKITTDEFMHGRKDENGERMDRGTGLSDWSVKDGIARALKHGYIICEVDDSDKARIKKYYGLKFRNDDALDGRIPPIGSLSARREPLSDGRNPTSKQRKPPTDKKETSYRSEKETLERNLQKNTIERKNGASLQNATVSTQDEDHSFVHSSLSLSSSQETKQTKPEEKPAIVLTEKEQQIVKFGKKDIFKAADPIIDEKLKEECAKLAELIETQGQFDSLVAVVRKRFPKGVIHLKNLTKPSVLNEWSQTQEQCILEPPVQADELTITDDALVEKIKDTALYYREDHRSEELLEQMMEFKRRMKLSNEQVYDMIINVSIGVQRDQGIDAFLEKLQYGLYW